MRKTALILLFTGYGFFWLGGVGAYWILGAPPAHVSWTAPLFLGLAGAIVLVTSAPRDLPRMFLCGAVGFIAEIAGVHTGFPFGAYSYTQALFPHIAGVPIVMLSAWIVLLTYIYEMLRECPWPRWLRTGTAALWMTAIDLVIDPLAAGPLDYWTWFSPGYYYGIPITNFVGWFLVSLAAFAVAGTTWRVNPPARWVGLSIVLFFVCVAFAKGLILAGVIGLALCGVHAVVRYRATRMGMRAVTPPQTA